jgi:hypothetical protein
VAGTRDKAARMDGLERLAVMGGEDGHLGPAGEVRGPDDVALQVGLDDLGVVVRVVEEGLVQLLIVLDTQACAATRGCSVRPREVQWPDPIQWTFRGGVAGAPCLIRPSPSRAPTLYLTDPLSFRAPCPAPGRAAPCGVPPERNSGPGWPSSVTPVPSGDHFAST